MKVSREQAAANRERILDEAARLFRERGFNGIGVADVMKSAGLTHGGFYGQFSSKEDLIAQVCQRAAGTMLEIMEARGRQLCGGSAGGDRGSLFVDRAPGPTRHGLPDSGAWPGSVAPGGAGASRRHRRAALSAGHTGSAHARKVGGSEAEEGHRDVCRHGRRSGDCARRE